MYFGLGTLLSQRLSSPKSVNWYQLSNAEKQNKIPSSRGVDGWGGEGWIEIFLVT